MDVLIESKNGGSPIGLVETHHLEDGRSTSEAVGHNGYGGLFPIEKFAVEINLSVTEHEVSFFDGGFLPTRLYYFLGIVTAGSPHLDERPYFRILYRRTLSLSPRLWAALVWTPPVFSRASTMRSRSICERVALRGPPSVPGGTAVSRT